MTMKLKLAMPQLRAPGFLQRRKRFNRSFQRFACQLDTSLTMIDRMYSFEGRIIDISRGGALFRPKLAYIMNRSDVPICIHLGSEELFGSIVSTSPKGFSIRFDEPLDEDLFDDLTADLRINPKTAA